VFCVLAVFDIKHNIIGVGNVTIDEVTLTHCWACFEVMGTKDLRASIATFRGFAIMAIGIEICFCFVYLCNAKHCHFCL